ncbi:hypothetical protein [Methylobacterium sp. Leaf93]|uniref:endonuclease/exonuclease/phosphatase family protein n=1 Tax=Methylobacterium sp. Leaf93 TaxID=1736249 RepID=UPI0006F8CA1B|nr:hypothetical protein [Methylobacterium sp. Leaf93]KQP13945.1 hypothetical protein ASF26_18360 [Methylobacterium sp. Leaf93]
MRGRALVTVRAYRSISIRILSDDIRHCRGMDGRLSPERVADITAACEADRRAKVWLRHHPEPLRLFRIDHVFVGPGVRVRRPEVARTTLARRASDHPPLLVELEIGLTPSRERPGG